MNVSFKGAQPEWGIRDPNLDECRELLLAADGTGQDHDARAGASGGMELIRLLAAARGGAVAWPFDGRLRDGARGDRRRRDHGRPTFTTRCPASITGNPVWPPPALSEPGIQAEIICDGVHVNPHMIDLAWKAKGREGADARYRCDGRPGARRWRSTPLATSRSRFADRSVLSAME
jgi:hypothetical protein